VLGELFRTRNAKKNKTNLMVFIRPKILMDGNQVAAETEAKYNYLRGIQTGRTKGRAPMLPGERQPTLPSMEQLSPPVAPANPAPVVAPVAVPVTAPTTVAAPVASEVPAVQKP
jgi:general secretion pathway protein D